jgi:hypothetical protein
VLKIADLVDDDGARRDRVIASLKDPAHAEDRDHVDIIIALGMAKEGFDWIWCEHALTVGNRSSLTEVVQIIGRATRDAPGKTSARFTNLIAEPDASDEAVNEAVNDTLKAIAASLLMEQVLAPKFTFTPKNAGQKEGFDYGQLGYQEGNTNVGFNEATGQFHMEIGGLVTPKSAEAKRICEQDINEVLAAFVQDRETVERGVFDDETPAEQLTQVKMGRIIADRYPDLDQEDQEAVRQHAVAAMAMIQKGKEKTPPHEPTSEPKANTAFVDGVRAYVLEVRDLEIDLIDRINPFQTARAILSKAMDEKTLREVAEVIAAKRSQLTYEEARMLAERAIRFKQEHGRLPSLTSSDAWERQMAEGIAFLQRRAAANA